MMSFETETNTSPKYDISLSQPSTYDETRTSTVSPFYTRKVAVIGLALFTSSLHLNDVCPAQRIDRDTAKTLVKPHAKDQLLDIRRQDLKMKTEVRKLASYKEGWSGLGSVPPKRESVEEAERFISIITKDNVLEPYISLAADGEINFYWKNDDFLLDIGFFGDGVYSLYAKVRSEQEIIEDDLSLEYPLPESVASLIRA